MSNWKQAMWRMSDGKSVMQFCRETGAVYETITRCVMKKKTTVDDACKKALERKGKKDGAAKYFIDGMSLYKYCLEKGLN